MEARASQRFDLSNISAVSSKSLYLSLTETMPPPSVVLKYPERDFKLIWSRLNSGVLCKLGRNILYLVIHERSWTKERGFRLNPTKYDTPLCPKCHLFVHLTTWSNTFFAFMVYQAVWDAHRQILVRGATLDVILLGLPSALLDYNMSSLI